jgi:hypothetical protein
MNYILVIFGVFLLSFVASQFLTALVSDESNFFISLLIATGFSCLVAGVIL